MGTMVYWMNVSIDLFIQGEEDEAGGGNWLRIGRQLHEEFNARARQLSLMVEGRVIHEMMEDFWPAAAGDTSVEPYLREYGQIWTTMPKVLVSNTRQSADHNTRLVGGKDALGQLAEIRAQTDGQIGVGGANLATQLLEHGLLDELLLYVHPAVLGSGRPLFDRLGEPIRCELLEHAVFDGGVALHRYQIRQQ
jgi:dihydrofolate reductase